MRESRTFAAPVEARASTDQSATIAGYAGIFGVEYDTGRGFTESIDVRAFNKSLNERKDLAVVWSHDVDRVLGTQESGTARFAVDERGLRYEADLDLLDPDGISAWRKISTGKVTHSSFGFKVVKDKWEKRDRAPAHRVLKEVRLFEVSPVLFPSSMSTEVDVKRAASSFAEYRHADPDTIEKAMRDGDLAEALAEETTEEPSPEPETHSEDTPQPEPVRPVIVKGLNG